MAANSDMNPAESKDFDAFVQRIVQPIAARPGHKRRMGNELLSHLHDAFEHQRRTAIDERAAVEQAMLRLGDIDDLRSQLQSSVPLVEQFIFKCLGQKEKYMWLRALMCIAAVVALTIVADQLSPRYGVFFVTGSIAALAAWALVNLLFTAGHPMLRWLGPRLGLLLGAFGMLFGTAIVLPAMAKLKQGLILQSQGRGVDGIEYVIFVAMALGAFIVLEGLGFVVYGIKGRPAQRA